MSSDNAGNSGLASKQGRGSVPSAEAWPVARLDPIPVDGLSDPNAIELAEEVLNSQRSGDRRPLVGEDGALRGPFNILLFVPAVGKYVERLGRAIRYETSMAPDLREFCICAVAATTMCDYEWSIHAPIAIQTGVDSADLQNLRSGSFDRLSKPGYRLLAKLVVALVENRDIDDGLYGELRGEYESSELVELVLVIGYYQTIAYLLNTFRVSKPPFDDLFGSSRRMNQKLGDRKC